MRKGLIHVYTGDGEGKTSAAFGVALRALGRGWRVCVIQFLKSGESGEVLALEKFPGVLVRRFGRRQFVDLESPAEEDKGLAQEGLEFARQAVYRGDYDLVLLDEINLAAAAGLVDPDDVVEILKNRPPSVELVLTGRSAPPIFTSVADYVTEFKKIKHPFDAGEKAREGVEF